MVRLKIRDDGAREGGETGRVRMFLSCRFRGCQIPGIQKDREIEALKAKLLSKKSGDLLDGVKEIGGRGVSR